MEFIILKLLNEFTASSETMRDVVAFVGHMLPPLLVSIVVLFLLLARGTAWREKIMRALEALGAGVIARYGITALIRLLYHRPRPFEAHQEIVQFIVREGNGFPSGHMAFLFAFTTVIWYFHRRMGWWLCGISVLVGTARVAAGVHYPSDIAGGVIVGMVVGYIVHQLTSKLKSRGFFLKIFHDNKNF